MKIQDIEIDFESDEERAQIYQRYIDYYNSSDKTIEATASLVTLREGLSNRKASIEADLNAFKDRVFQDLKEFQNNGLISKEALRELKWSLRHLLSMRGSVHNDRILNEVKDTYLSIEEEIEREQDIKTHYRSLKAAINYAKDHNIIESNLEALNYLIEEATISGFETLKEYDQLSKEERDRLRLRKLQGDKYWETSYLLYNESDDKTWQDIYKKIEGLREEEGLTTRYSSFESYKRAKSRYDKDRSEGLA